MSAKPEFVVNNLTRPTGAATGGFVINLTSSTTPMALSQPKDPTLAQFTFFVSRRLEDGRERFRLHMGYFETLQSAEEMLTIVRDVYPQAWAGEAPGKKLRANAAANTAAAPQKSPAAPARAAAPPPPPPVAKSAPPPAPPPAAPAIAAKPAPQPPAPKAPVQKSVAPPPAPAFEEPFLLSDDAPSFKPVDVPVIHPPAKPVVSPPRAAAPAPKPAQKPVQKPAQNSMPKPPAAPAKAAAPKPAAPPVAAKPATPARPPVAAPKIAAQVTAPAFQAATPAAPKAPPPEPTVQMPAISQQAAALSNVRQVIEELDDLSDTQTIRLLERHTPFREGSREADVDEAIRVIKPEDTVAMQAIKAEVKRNAPVLFAVQLDWSVTPFDMTKIPPLAIFNAYTLYTTEANREGRAWYGLRLGFFSDAVSAKQVAYYVRSDFKTVSVVPVTTIEKERATDLNASRSGIYKAANIKEVPAPTPESMTTGNESGVFQLLEDDMPAHIEQDVDGESSPRFSKPAAPSATPAAKPAAPAVSADAGKAAAKRKTTSKGTRRDAHAPTDEETLDQTLEILGANSLEITNDNTNDTGVRHLRVKIDKKGSKFASLIDRLSGKK